MDAPVDNILKENARRLEINNPPFDPITGYYSCGERQAVTIPDFLDGHTLYLPVPMFNECRLLQQVTDYGSIQDFLIAHGLQHEEGAHEIVAEGLIRERMPHDFPFWAASFVNIKAKGGGEDVKFVLNRPQRTILEPQFEKQRLANMPIREVIVKARQLGGSTYIQIKGSWMQICHSVGLNSLIVGHLSAASTEVEDMFLRMLQAYPLRLLYPIGVNFNPKESKFASVFGHPNIHRIPQRNCKIKIGTAENPDSARGGDYNLVHCTEVGLWKMTEKKTPEDIVASATTGILYEPNTMIVYESTAKGSDNFFHREYTAAKDGTSQFHAIFVAWYDIDNWSLPFRTAKARKDFAAKLWTNRENTLPQTTREEAGAYMWRNWERGATLEALHWYAVERAKFGDSAYMYSEFPSDDVEAFVYSGERVFDPYHIRQMEPTTKAVPRIGDLTADGSEGKAALSNIHFTPTTNGNLQVWEEPEIFPDEKVTNRYIVAVDIGGRSAKADWSVIVVFDRYWLMEGDKPTIVAQMRYHDDMDRLAWKAAQVAAWYDNALLVIESNTLETKDRERYVDGDNAPFILDQIRNVYRNLYARKQSLEEVKRGEPKKYGFHTNVSTKPALIDNLVRFVRDNLYVERDARALDELAQYERKPNGAYGAIAGCHDDLLMARAIALYVSTTEMPIPRIISLSKPENLAPPPIISEATI